MWENSNAIEHKKCYFYCERTLVLDFPLWLKLNHPTFSSVPSLLYTCVTIYPWSHRAIIRRSISVSEVYPWSNNILKTFIFLTELIWDHLMFTSVVLMAMRHQKSGTFQVSSIQRALAESGSSKAIQVSGSSIVW